MVKMGAFGVTCEGIFSIRWVPDRPVCPCPPVLEGLSG